MMVPCQHMAVQRPAISFLREKLASAKESFAVVSQQARGLGQHHAETNVARLHRGGKEKP
jgi:hypothetical protein